MSRVKNIVGERHCMLEVISNSGEYFSDGSVLWNCRCDCGNIKKLAAWQFRLATSCGCYRHIKDRKYNTYKTDGEVTYLYDSKGNCALIDTTVLPKVKEHYWLKSGKGYFVTDTGCKGNRMLLHHFVFEGVIPKGYDVDHENRNKSDNRNVNLRIATRAENVINRDLLPTNTSGYVGVSFMKGKNKFRAYITVNGKQLSLGLHETAELAYEARLKAEKKYFGEFSSKKGGDDLYEQ